MEPSCPVKYYSEGHVNLPMKLSFNYKRHKNRTMEERKARASIRGNKMLKYFHYDLTLKSAPMVDRKAVRMVVAHKILK